jgi:hypothetical protein
MGKRVRRPSELPVGLSQASDFNFEFQTPREAVPERAFLESDHGPTVPQLAAECGTDPTG